MLNFLKAAAKVTFTRPLSIVAITLALFAAPLRAHEVLPAIADMTEQNGNLVFDVSLNLEGILAGVNLTEVTDTNAAPEAAEYERLRSLAPSDFVALLRADWGRIAEGIHVFAGDQRLPVDLVSAEVPDVGDVEILRASKITFRAKLPANTQSVRFGWDAAYGALVIRQMGVEAPYDGYLEAGATSPEIQLSGGDQAGQWATFVNYMPIGFDHIVPKGLDHILFVLGLFFLSTRWRPLLFQVSAFTVAHTITLALASLGYVSVPGSVVEPLIAASIVFVAVENILTDGLSRWRPFVVFGFGLLHGLGFASVLGEFGLPQTAFLPALIGFNVGVEIGQLFVIAVAFALVGFWFGAKRWYRRVISIPMSAAIGVVGAWWAFERVFL